MTEKLEVEVTDAVHAKLAEMALKARLTEKELVGALLNSFVENGGKVYTGSWKEGPGLRVLPDWPRFSSGIVKLKKS